MDSLETVTTILWINKKNMEEREENQGLKKILEVMKTRNAQHSLSLLVQPGMWRRVLESLLLKQAVRNYPWSFVGKVNILKEIFADK